MPKYPEDNLSKQHHNDDSNTIIKHDPRYRLRPVQQMFSAIGGVIVTTLTSLYHNENNNNKIAHVQIENILLKLFAVTPLEVMKTRMQVPLRRCHKPYNNTFASHLYETEETKTSKNSSAGIRGLFRFHGFRETYKSIVKCQGAGGLYSGLIFTLCAALPSTVLFFVAYEHFKHHLSLLKYNENFEMLPNKTFFVVNSSLLARVLSTSVCAPFEMIRIKMQADPMTFSQVSQLIANIVKTRGITGMWHGLVPVLLRDAPFTAIYWTTYETIKSHYHQNFPSFYFSFMAGASAGTLAATLTTPFDVITTRSQVDIGNMKSEKDAKQLKILTPNNIRKQLLRTYQLEGIKGLFAGMTMRLMKVAPSSAIMIAVYEYANHFFYKQNQKKTVY